EPSLRVDSPFYLYWILLKLTAA
ncbi:uncharacterized protein METZ01_LOCUS338259, partial [marine metagenome]